MPKSDREKTFRQYCSQMQLPREFYLRSCAADVRQCYQLMNWNYQCLNVSPLTAVLVTSFFAFIGYTPTASCATNFVSLCSLAKTRLDEEIKEIALEGSATTTSMDPVFQVAEGPEKIKKKNVADNLYARVKSMYPHLREIIVPDKMLAPPLIFDMTNAVRTGAEVSNWPNLEKLATYRETNTVNGGKAKANANGTLVMDTTQHMVSFVDGNYPRAIANVNAMLYGLLASFLFYISSTDRDGSEGYVIGVPQRFFGTLFGVTCLLDRVTPMASHYAGNVRAFLDAWDKALQQIFRLLTDTKRHFDKIVTELLQDRNYFCAPVMAKQPEPGLSGREPRSYDGGKGGGGGGGGGGGRGGFSNFGCVDAYEGRVCRNGGPPPTGNCRYNHAPGALPSPRYLHASDPLKVSGLIPGATPMLAAPPPPGGAPPANAGPNAIVPAGAVAPNHAMIYQMMIAQRGRGRGRGRNRRMSGF